MSQYKDVAVGGVCYFWFAANTTAGAAGDGATPLYDVRLAGAASTAIPTASGTPTLLTHANYTDGLHEIAIDTTGYSAGSEYAVFCTLTISTVNPAGFVGSFIVRAAASTLYDLATAILADTTVIGTPAGASIAADLVVIDNFVDGLEATIGAAGAGLTALGDTRIANLDAAVSSRSTYAGGAVASVTAGVTVTTNNDKSGYSLTATTGLGNQTANITGNLSGSTGSVTGAVGSVTAPVAITSNIKQNQTLTGFTFLMTDSTNHNPATGLTVTVTRSIDGAAFAAGTLSAVTEVSNGVYSVNFGAGDLNGKVIILQATAAGADTTFERIVTQI